jgi:hypothetical protein
MFKANLKKIDNAIYYFLLAMGLFTLVFNSIHLITADGVGKGFLMAESILATVIWLGVASVWRCRYYLAQIAAKP